MGFALSNYIHLKMNTKPIAFIKLRVCQRGR